MLEIYPHLPSPFSFFLLKFPTMFFLIASYKDIENSILQPNAFMMR